MIFQRKTTFKKLKILKGDRIKSTLWNNWDSKCMFCDCGVTNWKNKDNFFAVWNIFIQFLCDFLLNKILDTKFWNFAGLWKVIMIFSGLHNNI